MMVFYPGSCIIRGYAYLELPRFQHNTINSFVIDAAIAGSSYRSTDHVLCGTLQFNERLRHCFLDARIYSIQAKIVQFVADTHEPSNLNCDHHKDFIGDLINIESIDGPALPIAALWSNPTRIDCSGTVFVADEETDSFIVNVWQEIWGIPPLTPITIRAIVSIKHYDDRPYQHLPELHSIIHFGGDLLTIEDGTAFVALQYHSYFPCQKDEVFELQFA